MSAAVCPSEPQPHHQRARGQLDLAVRRRGDATVLADLRQEGCLKARLPRPERDAWTSVVTLNTSGGIAGGDALQTHLEAGPNTAVTLAAQAAERYYRALPDAAPARIRTAIRVDAGAALEWLPQETILFDRCALDRRLEVELAPDGWFLGIEMLVFGRAAMGEQVRQARLADTIRIRRDGRLVLHDSIRLTGAVQDMLARPAGGAPAVATLVLASPDAAAWLEPLRAALAGAEAGASSWDGLLVARVLAADGACLRAAIVAGLVALRGGRPLPRVWMC